MSVQVAPQRSSGRRRRRNRWRERRRALRELFWGDGPAAVADTGPAATLSHWGHALVLGLFASIAVVVSWPLVTRFGSHVPSDGGDALQNLWNYWWLREAILAGRNPYWMPLIYAPEGAPLYLHTVTPINGLLSLPFQPFGLTVAYNAVVLLLLVLAAYCTFLLVTYLTGNWVGGFVGGVIFAFGSYHITHLLGHANLLSSAWLPLGALAFLRAADATGRRRTLRTGVLVGAFLLLVLADWQYALFGIVVVGLLALWLAVARRSLAPIAIISASVVLLAVLIAPLLAATIGEMRGGLAEVPDPDGARVYSADVMNFLIPPERHSVWGAWAKEARARLPAPPVEGDIFLGFVPLALGLWALIFDRRRALRWWAIGLVFAVLALGPILHFRGNWRYDGADGSVYTIPMPFALVQRLPLLNFLRVPLRLAVVVTLALAALGGIAVAQVARRWPALRRPRLATPLTALLAALLAFEHLAIPFPLEATAVPQFYRELAASPERGTILEWPLSFKRARSNYYQTVHGRPIMGGYIARRLAYPVRALPPFRELPRAEEEIYTQPESAANLALWTLRWADVHWIVVYRDDPVAAERDIAELRATLADGPPIYADETLVVFRPRAPVGTAAMFLRGPGWHELEQIGGARVPTRWFAASAGLTVWHFGEAEGRYALRFDAWSFNRPRRLLITLDGRSLGEYRVDGVQAFDLPLTLPVGRHQLELRSLDPPVSPAELGYAGDDTRPLAFAISRIRLVP